MSRAASGNRRPLVYNHIPKTAGTALREAISSGLRDAQVVHVLDHVMFGDFTDFRSIAPAMRSQIVATPSELPEFADFVTGHISPWTTRRRYPRARHLTALREPRSRLVSQWLFNRAHTDFMIRHWGNFDAWFKIGRASLSEWLDSTTTVPISDNAITRFLVWPTEIVPANDFIHPETDQRVLAAARESLARFDHIALVEDPHMTERLGAWLGRELIFERHNDVRPMPRHLRPRLIDEVSANRKRIEHLTRLDTVLWREVAATLMPTRDLAALADDTFDGSLTRSQQALDAPTPSQPLRRLAEIAYGMRPGRRRA